MHLLKLIIAVIFLTGLFNLGMEKENNQDWSESKKFKELEKLIWKEVLYDSCTEDWNKNWFLDGKKAKIINSEKGMDFVSGPIRRENASHAVLWTKESFHGHISSCSYIIISFFVVSDIKSSITNMISIHVPVVHIHCWNFSFICPC